MVAAAVLSFWLVGCAKRTPDALVEAAQRHLADHDAAAAQIELRNAIQADPRHGLAHRLLGSTMLRQGDPVGAEATLRKALELGQRAEDVLPALVLAMLRQGQAQPLIDEFGRVDLAEPGAQASVRSTVGHAWLEREEWDAAAAAFDAALRARPGDGFALLGQARIAGQQNRLDDALALADAAAKSDEGRVEVHVYRSQLLSARGEPARAIEAAEKALGLDTTYLPARLALASILIEARNYEKADAVLGAAGRAGADPRVQTLKAVVALRRDDLAGARAAAAQALKAAPEDGLALALAGEIEMRSGNHGLAEQHLTMAVRVRPGPDVRRLLAAVQLRLGRPGKALATLEPLLQELDTRRNAALLLLAGEAFLGTGDLARAGEYFEAAKGADATGSAARMRLGQLALRSGEFTRGEQELVAASELGRQSIEPDLLLVSLYLRRQEGAKALAAVRSFVRKQPQNPMGHVLAGTAQILQQDRPSARQSFEAALRIQPDHLPALRALTGLDVAEGKPSDARQRFEALLVKSPDDEALLVALAALQEQLGQPDAAAATLRKAIDAHAAAPGPVIALVRLHLRRKEAAAAIDVAQAALRRNADDLMLSLELANAQEAAGAPRDAVRTLMAAAAKDAKAVAPLIQLARLHARQRDPERAAITLTRVLEKAPDNDDAARDLASVHLQAGKADRALAVARELQVRRPNAALGHAIEGDVFALARRWEDAARAYGAALKVDADAGDVAAQMYRALFALGRRAHADAFAADWVSRHPADVTMRLLVADAAQRERAYPKAIEQYEAALRVDPAQPLVLASLAVVLAQAKDPRAPSVAERARTLAPNDPEVLSTLGRVQLERP